MNNYIVWGNINKNILIDNTSFVFINGFSEFIATFLFIFLLITILVSFNLKKINQDKTPKANNFLISLSISISLFMCYLLAMVMSGSIMSAISDNNFVDLVSTSPLLFNPSFSIAYMLKGFNYLNATFYIPVGNGFIYILFEIIGAFLASLCAYYFYKPIFDHNKDNYLAIRNCFYTGSETNKNKYLYSFVHETINTFIFMALILGSIYLLKDNYTIGLGIVKQLLVCVSLLVVLIALGGIIGNALNPVRDFLPRIVYGIYFKHDRIQWKKDFKYSWIPVVGPTIGCILGVIIMPGFLY